MTVRRPSRHGGRSRSASGQTPDDTWHPYVGSPAQIADDLRPLIDLGFRHLLVDTPAPYDLETIDRIGEVLALLNG